MMSRIDRRKFLTLSAMGTASLASQGRHLNLVFEENPLKKEVYHFKIGDFNCISFNTGYYDYDISLFFDGIPAKQVQAELGLSEPPETVKSPYVCVYIDTGKHRVLVDCGIGTYLEDEDRLQILLKQEGISNKSIDTVIVTHAHPDHVGGLLDRKGNLCFSNANYYSSELEWEFFKSDEAFNEAKEDYPDYALFQGSRTVYESIKSELVFIEPETEIIPGIKVINASGHTPGQFAVVVTSLNEQLICISDVVFHPLHLKHPDWLPIPRYMFDPVEFKKTKKRILNMAADEKMLVSAMHFYPPPSLGYVSKNENRLEWHPIE